MNKCIKHIKAFFSLRSVKVLVIFLIMLIVLIGSNGQIEYNSEQLFYGIISGSLVGIVILLFEVFIDVEKLKMHETIKKSSLVEVLKNRQDKEYYGKQLKKTKERLWIMGDTASRFFQDFGSPDADSVNRVIDKLLNDGVEIRILLFKNSDTARQNLSTPYIKKYDKFENFSRRDVCKNKFTPQSIFIFDTECIIGSMFTGIESRDTPAMHFGSTESIFTKSYVNYFNTIWESTNDSN